MKKQNNIIEVRPVQEETLNPEEFIELLEKNPSMIGSSRIITPRLGSKGFGSIHVNYSRPRYRPIKAFEPVAR